MTPARLHTPGSSSSRRFAVPAAAAALIAPVVLTAGCTIFSPLQTDIISPAGDGVNADLGTVALRNLVVVAQSKDAPALITGALINQSTQKIDVGFSLQNAATQTPVMLSLDPGEAKPLNGLQIAGAGATPGAMVEVMVATPDAGNKLVNTPVLPPRAGGPYATVTPTTKGS